VLRGKHTKPSRRPRRETSIENTVGERMRGARQGGYTVYWSIADLYNSRAASCRIAMDPHQHTQRWKPAHRPGDGSSPSVSLVNNALVVVYTPHPRRVRHVAWHIIYTTRTCVRRHAGPCIATPGGEACEEEP
jgi:hypothetical protein